MIEPELSSASTPLGLAPITRLCPRVAEYSNPGLEDTTPVGVNQEWNQNGMLFFYTAKGRKEAGREKMRFFGFASPAGFLLRAPPPRPPRPLGGSLHPAILVLVKLRRGLCANLCVFARNSSFLSQQHTITHHSNVA